jgi:hypothetical protein
VDLVVVEDGGGVAEDEVDAAGDEAVEVVLAAEVGKQRVLVGDEAAVLEDGAVGSDGRRYGLAAGGGGRWGVVLEGDVVGLELVAVDLGGGGEEGPAGGGGVLAGGDDDVGGGFAEADQRDAGAVAR